MSWKNIKFLKQDPCVLSCFSRDNDSSDLDLQDIVKFHVKSMKVLNTDENNLGKKNPNYLL